MVARTRGGSGGASEPPPAARSSSAKSGHHFTVAEHTCFVQSRITVFRVCAKESVLLPHLFIIEVLKSCSHYLLVGISLLQLMSDENHNF